MRVLRVRRGFQADHSSSSYLFYAVDQPVSAEGQRTAHQFSSRAEVNRRSARYLKWGESSLASTAYKALLGKHHDVMVSESYDWWTMMIAVPKTVESERLLAPFRDAGGYDDLGVDVEDYGSRLVAVVYCALVDGGAGFACRTDDPIEYLAKLLVKIRGEILRGDVSFLEGVASFYGADEEDEEEAEEGARDESTPQSLEGLRKAGVQQACVARGISFRKAWTKAQLLEALRAAAPREKAPRRRRPKLSRAAREIVGNLELV